MLRALVTAAFLFVALLVLWLAFVVGADTSMGTLLINLGTEIVGIVMTVAVVEWFFERRRLQTRGRQLAWDALHAAQTAVWVWQGGPREMGRPTRSWGSSGLWGMTTRSRTSPRGCS